MAPAKAGGHRSKSISFNFICKRRLTLVPQAREMTVAATLATKRARLRSGLRIVTVLEGVHAAQYGAMQGKARHGGNDAACRSRRREGSIAATATRLDDR
jgi:hypothetical protein